MMRFEVLLTEDAAQDLEELYDYISLHDMEGKAEYVLDKISLTFNSLTETPERGGYPKELLALGIRDYRQVFFKPYRIIYRILGSGVYIMLIADGRRDMQTLLQRRLFEA